MGPNPFQQRESPVPPADLPGDSLVSYRPGTSLSARRADREDATQLSMTRWAVSLPSDTETAAGKDAPDGEGPGQYLLRRKVGQGGFGEVWEAIQVSLNRIVAVKRVREDLLEQEGRSESEDSSLMRAESFRQEALATANLDHPNIVPVHDLGLDEKGMPLLAMKYVRGRPWDVLLREDFESLSVGEYLARHIPILIDMTQAVAFAHSKGVVHRDLKPSQVMVGQFGETMLMDWGLAVVYNQSLLVCTETACGTIFPPTPDSASNPAGTLAFMAPEQTEKTAKNIGPWTDVWLLGGTLYYILSGRLPHRGDDARQVFLKAHLGHVTPPDEANPDRAMPEELVDIVRRAMNPMIQERLQTAKEFLDLLNDFQSGATRRRESQHLTEQVAASLVTCQRDYRTLSEAQSSVSRAAALWEENPEVPRLRNRALAMMVDSALENGDLVLARLQADALSEKKLRREAQARVAAAELDALRRERHRRWATIAAVCLLATVITIVSVFNRRISLQRDRAATARDDAEQIMSFMLGDLLQSLEPQGQLEPVKRVGERVVEYFDQLPPGDATPETRRKQLDAVGIMANTLLQMGESDAALRFAQRYVEEAEEIAADGGASPEFASLIATGYGLLSRIYALQGDRAQSQHAFAKALACGTELLVAELARAGVEEDLPTSEEIMALVENPAPPEDPAANVRRLIQLLDRLAQLHLDRPELLRDYASGYSRLATSMVELGEPDEAIEVLRKGVAMRERIRELLPDEPRPVQRLIESHISLGSAHEANGDVVEAMGEYIKALALAEEAFADGAYPYSWLVDLARGYSSIGRLSRAQGDLAAAGEALDSAVALSRRLAQHDPLNALWQQDFAQNLRALGALKVETNQLVSAEEDFDDAWYITRRLTMQDPRNVRWREEYAALLSAHLDLARRLLDELPLRAEIVYTRAALMADELLAVQPDSTDYARYRALAAVGLADLALARDDASTAAAALEPVIQMANELDRTALRTWSLMRARVESERENWDAAFGALSTAAQNGLPEEEAGDLLGPLQEHNPDRFRATFATPQP